MGAMALQLLDAEDINEKLPGIGVRSHYGLIFDLVPIGASMVAKHDELLPICIALISARTGRPYCPMLCAPAICMDGKSGEPMADQVETSMKSHPAHLDKEENKSRCAGIGGDGGVTIGGSAHRHRSNRCAEILWSRWHDTASLVCTTWDRMHQGAGLC